MPVTGGESYLEWIKNPYRRMKGFSTVKRDDIVVFNFPHGDTVLKGAPTDDYYTHVRLNGREYTHKMYGPVVVRPDDKKDHYVKRCVAIAGDTLSIVNGKVIVNSVPQKNFPGIQNTYTVYTNGTQINQRVFDQLGLNIGEIYFDATLPGYNMLPLNEDELGTISALPNVAEVRPNIDIFPPEFPDSQLLLFPFTKNFEWTKDNYGPIWIPKAGSSVQLTESNLPLYSRIISSYENNSLEIIDGEIFINGQKADSYTFKMDYYFMMGDNRHNSLDSRYWGFVPESHVVGTPSVIWFSKDNNKSFPKNIRWKRIFKFV
jgi:signal peptidase I